MKNCKKSIVKIFLLGFLMPFASTYSQVIQWPAISPGPGVDSWGFNRPQGCQPDATYLKAWQDKASLQWFGGQTALHIPRNEYVSGGLADMIRQGKGNPEAIRSLQRDIDKVTENWKTLTTVNAKAYGQLTAGSMGAEEFTKRALSFNLPVQCNPMPQSGSGAAACGTAAALFQATANYERFVQIACHLGARLPVLNLGISGSSSGSSVSKTTGDLNLSQNEARESQQMVQSSQQSAQQNQARADQQRQGKRKTNDPAAQASNCLEIDKDAALYGGFKNTCEYKVNYVFCNFGPKKDSWADFHNCEKKNGIGAWQVGGGRASAAHTKNTAMVYWFACKDPATPVDSDFVLGKGIEARCHN